MIIFAKCCYMKKAVYSILLLLAGLFVACKNEEVEEPVVDPTPQETEEETKEDVLPAETTSAALLAPVAFNGVFVEASSNMLLLQQQHKKMPSISGSAAGYPLIDWTPKDGTWPLTLTVDYGTDPIAGTDGLEHTGVLVLDATAAFETEGSVLTPQFQNFYVYGNTLSGKQRIENKGKNERGNLVYEVSVSDGQMGSEEMYVYKETTLRELVKGLQADGTLAADVKTHEYSISGGMSGESKVDSLPSFAVEIADDNPMLIGVGNLYPTSGVVHITLTPALSFDLSMLYAETGVAGAPKAFVENITLSFEGKNADGTYQMQVGVSVEMGLFEQMMQISFAANEEGIVQESVKWQIGE